MSNQGIRCRVPAPTWPVRLGRPLAGPASLASPGSVRPAHHGGEWVFKKKLTPPTTALWMCGELRDALAGRAASAAPGRGKLPTASTGRAGARSGASTFPHSSPGSPMPRAQRSTASRRDGQGCATRRGMVGIPALPRGGELVDETGTADGLLRQFSSAIKRDLETGPSDLRRC